MHELKKRPALTPVNTPILEAINAPDTTVILHKVDEAELDETWSFVGNKQGPRWLWQALDQRTSQVLAYVFGRRKDEVFFELKALLEPFGITRYFRFSRFFRGGHGHDHCIGWLRMPKQRNM